MTDRSPRHTAALAFAASGIPVFPCQVNGKKPLPGSNGFQDATTDIKMINYWWAQADYNVAIEPERAGWAVVDTDSEEGLQRWTEMRLSGDRDATPTYSVRTPRGGFHFYYEGSLPSSVQKLGPKIDTRGRG